MRKGIWMVELRVTQANGRERWDPCYWSLDTLGKGESLRFPGSRADAAEGLAEARRQYPTERFRLRLYRGAP